MICFLFCYTPDKLFNEAGTVAGPTIYQQPVTSILVLSWGGKNTHTGALSFYPIFIPLLSVRFQVSVCKKVSGVGCQVSGLKAVKLKSEH
jgi:hypothetical protein